MNRIILIGNGFDLAHDLKTSYRHFIDNYWSEFAKKVYDKGVFTPWKDELVDFGLIGTAMYNYPYVSPPITSYSDFRNLINRADEDGDIIEMRINNFFKHISEKMSLEKWVDIENEYYRLLKDIHRRQSAQGITQAKSDELKKELKYLNENLTDIKDKLAEYLKTENNNLNSTYINDNTKRKIFEPIKFADVSNGGQNLFFDSQKERLRNVDLREREVRHLIHIYGHNENIGWNELQEHKRLLPNNRYMSDADNSIIKFDEHKRRFLAPRPGDLEIPSYFLLPENILFLNFNYTETANLYISGEDEFKLNYIHGELGEDKELERKENPIIFGYGDEIDESYAKIAEQNENEYLKNIKSIRYLETDNYRRLLTLIDSSPYQIYIMGHSCGNSDRTLLNTLFEHKNCVSIKPFYYKKPDGTDDYIDIVQNISRNFKDATLMRDRVVNKTYCEPLPQNPPPVSK